MQARIVLPGHKLVLGLVTGALSVVLWGTSAWAATRIGDNIELLAWYRQRHTFHTDGGRHFDWVQWRNELFGWLVYEDLIKNGQLFNQIDIPWVKSATLNARYRVRYDPVYQIREHFDKLYDDEEKESFIIPENGFRDVFLDFDFGRVGPGYLSMRVGRQQIVWGESDLFRSLDIINPLRIDQNQAVGEKFDEFRSPILALKLLYEIGNVGSWFSNVAIEPFYTPAFRSGISDLIEEGVFRVPFHERGCLDDNDELIPFDIARCSQPRADGSRVFVPYRPEWIGVRRRRNPWGFATITANQQNLPDTFICLTRICSPDVFGHRASLIPTPRKGDGLRALKGINDHTHAGGFRIIGSTWFGMDFSLNYMTLPSGVSGTFDYNSFLVDPAETGGASVFKPEVIYGDAALAEAFGLGTPAGDFQEGLRRCLSDSGKGGDYKSKDRGNKTPTFLVGADLRGYNHPDRLGPNGAVDPATGHARPGRHHALRVPITFCGPAKQQYTRTHVMGFTATYNDFDYTGAVFRLEQSYSTKEVIRFVPGGNGYRAAEPVVRDTLRNDIDNYTGVWRSMVGFDLFQSLPFFRYVPGIHNSFYTQAWFISGQWLMENYWHNVANNTCQNNDNLGTGVTTAEADAFRADNPGLKAWGGSRCRRERYNHLFTLSLGNQGLFGSRLETRNAIVYEPGASQTLFYTQNWWRNVLGNPNLELSMGMAWYAGSSLDDSWSSLHLFASRDQVWFEVTYYLL